MSQFSPQFPTDLNRPNINETARSENINNFVHDKDIDQLTERLSYLNEGTPEHSAVSTRLKVLQQRKAQQGAPASQTPQQAAASAPYEATLQKDMNTVNKFNAQQKYPAIPPTPAPTSKPIAPAYPIAPKAVASVPVVPNQRFGPPQPDQNGESFLQDTNKLMGMMGTVPPVQTWTQPSDVARRQNGGQTLAINKGMSGSLPSRDPRYQDPNKNNPLSERAEDAPVVRDYPAEIKELQKKIHDIRVGVTDPSLKKSKEDNLHKLNVDIHKLYAEAKTETDRNRRTQQITDLNDKHAKEDAAKAKEGEDILQAWKEQQQKQNPNGIPYTPQEVNKVVELINSGGKSSDVTTLINNIRNPAPAAAPFVSPSPVSPPKTSVAPTPEKPAYNYPNTFVGRKAGTQEPLTPQETTARANSTKLLNYLSNAGLVSPEYTQEAMKNIGNPQVAANIANLARTLTPQHGVKLTDTNQFGQRKYQEPKPQVWPSGY